MQTTLSIYDRRRLAVECRAAEKTVTRACRNPQGVRESTLLRLRDVAERLGLPSPPSVPTSKGALAST
jgi:hypothetical protein